VETPNVNEPVSGVAFASRLKNGNTLITDSNHSRIVEIDSEQNVVWEYFTSTGKAAIWREALARCQSAQCA
jgi:hypothetical protein